MRSGELAFELGLHDWLEVVRLVVGWEGFSDKGTSLKKGLEVESACHLGD